MDRKALAVAVVVAGTLVACSEEPPPEPGTWYGEVGAIVRTKCAGCHRDGGIAPFSLYDHADAVEEMPRMIDAVDRGIMPPFFANDTPDCVPRFRWHDDPRLTDAERAALHAWVDAGGPAGHERELPAPPSTELAGANVRVDPVEPFTSSGTRDQFVCVLFDPHITRDQWLTGSQVFPTANELVHHVNVYLVAPGTKGASAELGVPYAPCDNPPGLAIQSWLPGNPALELPAGVGIPVAAGTLVGIQIHYHPAGGGGPDATSVALRLVDDKPAWRYLLGVYGNSPGSPVLQPDRDDPPGSDPVFVVPANIPDHEETMIMRHAVDLATELRILSVTPHMHFLGTHERATVKHNDGTSECLVDSGWNFDWQRTYRYDAKLTELPVFDPGSAVTVSCRWDNTFGNPNLPRLLSNSGNVAPYDVQLGLTSADEMCLADFGIVTPN